jgi:hypothetical protein
MLERSNPRLKEVVDAFHEPFRGVRRALLLAKLVRWGDPTVVLARTAALLAQIAAPTLVAYGRSDGIIPEEFSHRAADIIPNASLQAFETGHFLPLNIPDVLSKRLESFLNADQPATAEAADRQAGRHPQHRGQRPMWPHGRGTALPDAAVGNCVLAAQRTA